MFLTDILRFHSYGIRVLYVCRCISTVCIRMRTNLCNGGVYMSDIKPKRNQITRKKSANECVSAFSHSLLVLSFQLFVAPFLAFLFQLCCELYRAEFSRKKVWFLSVYVIFFREKNISRKIVVCVCMYVCNIRIC